MGEFFVNRPIVAMVIAIVLIIVGVVAMTGLPVAQYPDITPPEVKVEATYTGANAVAVEQSVATALEQKVNGVENMLYMKSTNASNGQMTLTVSFDVGSDLDISNVLVQNRVSEGTPQLPEEVKRQGVTVKKALAFPMMLVTLRSPDGTFDANFLNNYMSINVQDEIARLTGVGQVTIFGGADYAMRIWIKPDQLSRLGLTVPDITGAVQQQNVLTPAGKLGGPPAPAGTEFAYAVQTRGRLETPEEFGQVVVRSNPDGSQVLLRDVARIELGAERYEQIGRFNSNPPPCWRSISCRTPMAWNWRTGCGKPWNAWLHVSRGIWNTSFPWTRPNPSPPASARSSLPCSRRWRWSFSWFSSFCRTSAPR